MVNDNSNRSAIYGTTKLRKINAINKTALKD